MFGWRPADRRQSVRPVSGLMCPVTSRFANCSLPHDIGHSHRLRILPDVRSAPAAAVSDERPSTTRDTVNECTNVRAAGRRHRTWHWVDDSCGG